MYVWLTNKHFQRVRCHVVKANTHRRRRHDSIVELSRVGVGSVYWALRFVSMYVRVGNDNLHLMTFDKRHRLRVDLADYSGNTRCAEYDDFQVDSFRDKYRLVSLGAYNGTAGITNC